MAKGYTVMIDQLHGPPPCPFCNTQLSHRDIPLGEGESRWHCKICLTEWNIMDLLEALNDNEELAEQEQWTPEDLEPELLDNPEL